MLRPPNMAAALALAWCWLLGVARLAAADFIIQSDIEQYYKLADENNGFPVQRFRSSDIVAPVFHVNTWEKDLTDELPYIFLGVNYHKAGGRAGPVIINARDLSLVYSDQTWGNSYDSEPQTIHGRNHLTFWAQGHGRGDVCVIVDENYNIVYNVTAVAPHHNDMHEFHVTDEGTAVFTTWRNIPFDCSRWGGAKECTVHDTGFQEVDLETNDVLFSWWSADHFDPDDSFARFVPDDFGLNDKREGNYDLSHMNGVRKTEDGNYLISVRHFFCVQLIDGKTGDAIWTLGGKKNQFKDLSDGRATNMGWQHNARFYRNQSHITLFDNHKELQGDCTDDCETRGLHVEIDTAAMTARVVREYYHPGKLNSLAMGGMHMFDGSGSAMTAWGWTPSYVEFTADGTVALDMQRGRVGVGRQSDMFAYRVFKGNWTGRPTWPPSLAVDKDEPDGGGDDSADDAKTTVYMSWNGATDIDKWAVYSSDRTRGIDRSDNLVQTASRSGFETSATIDSAKLRRYVAVAAVDAHGDTLGVSPPFDLVDMELKEAGTGGGSSSTSVAAVAGAAGGVLVVAGLSVLGLRVYRRWKSRATFRNIKYMPI